MTSTPEVMDAAAVNGVVPAAVWLKIIFVAGLGVIGGFIGRVFWDHYNSGRSEKTSIFVKTPECIHHRERCDLGNLWDKVNLVNINLETFKAATEAVQAETEKRVKEANMEIAAIRLDISAIRDCQAKSNVLLQILVDRQGRQIGKEE